MNIPTDSGPERKGCAAPPARSNAQKRRFVRKIARVGVRDAPCALLLRGVGAYCRQRAAWDPGKSPMFDARPSRLCPLAACGALALAIGGVVACGSDKASGVAGPKLPQGARSQTLQHEDCSESGSRVEMLDTNNDGKTDIRRVFDGS